MNARPKSLGLNSRIWDFKIESWLAGTSRLAAETRAYVVAITGHTIEDWARDRQRPIDSEEPVAHPSCLAIVASLRAKDGERVLAIAPDLPFEGNFLTAIKLLRKLLA